MQLPLAGRAWGVAALLLVGCQEPSTRPPVPLPDNPYVEAAERDVGLALDSSGVQIIAWSAGLTEAVPFGTETEATLAALTALRAAPDRQPVAGCDARSMAQWPDGLMLWFDDATFVGWTIDGRQPEADRIATLDGFGVGSTRAELAMVGEVPPDEATVEISGVRVTLDGVRPTARATTLQAGMTCGLADG